MSLTLDGVARLAEAILGGGVMVVVLAIVNFFIKKKRLAMPDQVRTTEQGIVERALINVQRSNDELTDDITRVRQWASSLQEEARRREDWWQARWDLREDRWNCREAELISEVDAMRASMTEMQARMAAMIQELDDLRRRAASGLA